MPEDDSTRVESTRLDATQRDSRTFVRWLAHSCIRRSELLSEHLTERYSPDENVFATQRSTMKAQDVCFHLFSPLDQIKPAS